MDIVITIGITLLLLVLIVFSCAIFTNGIEWLGHRFQLSDGAVGSVLAAVGTALPETLVPIIALLSGALGLGQVSEQASHEIGVGAILGAPFLLSTLAMCITGLAVFFFAARKARSTEMPINLHLFRRDFHYFFIAYGLAIVAALVGNALLDKLLAGGLLALYGLYVWRTFQKEHIPDAEFHIDPLFLSPKSPEPATSKIVWQVVLGLVAIIVMAHLFVEQVNHLSHIFKINALVLSLIIIPIATELPEKFNSVVWIGQKKDNLSLGNITGAMVFQSCLPVSVGLLFTPWTLSPQALLSVTLCLMSAAAIYLATTFSQRLSPVYLLIGGLFYAIFLVYSLGLMPATGA
jgi:cation:H+ antiporter